ncbi:MAG: acyl carrier protein [Acidobacteria bacterium]|nr:acyl carrier protein [Acidobacteriota bacterium]
MTIANELRCFIVDNYLYGQANGWLTEDTSFLESAILDSTGILELIGFIQERFHIRLEDEEIIPDNLDSIRKVANFLSAKLESSARQEVTA